MSNNSSSLPETWCTAMFPTVSFSVLANADIILAACVVTLLLAPFTVTGNAYILAAIWRNPSLRAPSYVLLAGLAVTDFCTGLLSQPFFAVYKLAEITGNKTMRCVAGLIGEIAGLYFSSFTLVVLTMIAVERWLHVSRRSLLTVRRIAILYCTTAACLIFPVAGRMYAWFSPVNAYFTVVVVFFVLAGALCIIIKAFSYFKVLQIIRHHQNQVQANQNGIDMHKYKKSVFTILYILAIFILSYVPYLCSILVFNFIQDYGDAGVTFDVCATVVFSSSFFNPLLYYCRVKEIRESVKGIIRNLFCNRNGEES